MTAEVAIVGLGPVGATLANYLGQAGIVTEVHERSIDPHPLPRACHLDAEIMRIFQAVGLSEEIGGIVEPSAGMEFVDLSLEHLFTYEDFARDPILGWEEDYVFIQPELDAILRGGIERFPSVEVRLGSEVSSASDLDASFIVACDGARSSMRREAGVEQVDLGFDEEWLVVDVMLSRPVALPGIIQQICHPDRAATFVPSAGPHRRWEFRLEPTEDREAVASPEAVWKRLAPWLGPDDGDLVRAVIYEFHAVVADRWRVGDVFLAGDAAHQMPPFMGQGMCSGIRDAVNLGWKLVAVLRDRVDPELLGSYELERRPHVERCIELSIEAGRLVSAIDPVFPAPDTDDGERWSRLPPLTTGVFSTPIEWPVGHQARQPTVIHRGSKLRLDDLAGPGWSLVTRGGSPGSAFASVIETASIEDPEGWVERMLGDSHAMLIRPDRYVYGVATGPDGVGPLLTSAQLAIGAIRPR
jgi:3-(3-hydroxy-phenyl)propionate hydroxylase